MRQTFLSLLAVSTIVTFANVFSARADCGEDVAKAFAKQRDKAAYRMKTRQFSEHGLV